MKVNKWTIGLATVGLVSLPAVVQAEEKMSPVNTALNSTVISGYVNVAGQWNFGTGNANVPTYKYNTPGKQDGFSLNAAKVSIERPLDESQWAAGYKLDLMFGEDADSFGTDVVNTDNFAIRQAYVALRAPVGNGLDFKVGVFDAIIGYESHDAGNNPNYTRSYGYTSEPASHTGVLASYRFADWMSASVGVANTVGPVINQQPWSASNYAKAESFKTYMGAITLTAPEDWGWIGGSSLYGGVVSGYSPNGNVDGTAWYAAATIATPLKGLRTGISYDYRGIGKQPLTDPTVVGHADGGWFNAAALYLSYQATEKLSLHTRGEIAWTSYDGVVHGDNYLGNAPESEKVVALTQTIQYDLWKNVISRLEFRWDHAADGTHPYGGKGNAGESLKKDSFMVAVNIIYKF